MNSIEAPSFCDTTLLHGLLDIDVNIELSLNETSSYQMPQALRHLFATILVCCKPDNLAKLWKKFELLMFDDYAFLYTKSQNIRSKVLAKINHILESMGKTINDYHLVDHITHSSIEENTLKEINEELQIIVDDKDLAAIKSLNHE